MSYQKSYLLLPCHSLEDFPTFHEGDEAEGLLAAWTALWHPWLLAQTGSLPDWIRADDPPADCRDTLIVVPQISREQLPTGFLERAEAEARLVIVGETNRDVILERILTDAGDCPDLLTERAPDFLALAYCFLQIELLTRQMRYTSNLDEVHFGRQTVAAAEAAMAGDEETTDRLLHHAFDLLAEERDHYYAVDAFLVDLTLLAPTTLDDRLTTELCQSVAPINLLLNGELLEALAKESPETLHTMAARWKDGELGIVGGDGYPFPWPWMRCESLRRELLAGTRQFQDRLGQAPRVYGRHRFGLTPLLPLILNRLGFCGALHATFDEGNTPAGTQAKVRWEAPDGTSVDAIARGILDASRPETFLGLALKLGEAMDMEHVATLTLAHWPGRTCRWYDDLRRIGKFGQPLGKFVTVESYFGDDSYPGHLESLKTDISVSPFLNQAIAAHRLNILSRLIDYERTSAAFESWKSIAAMRAAWQHEAGHEEAPLDDRQIDAMLESHDYEPCDAPLSVVLEAAAKKLVQPLETDSHASGYWLVNPTVHPRRVPVRLPQMEPPPVTEAPVYAAESIGDEVAAVVDVPAMGFVWLGPGSEQADTKKSNKSKRRREPLLAEESVLRNEFFEAIIQETTGSLRAIRTYGSRGNRMSQQIALKYGRRFDPENPHAGYSVMVADRFETTCASSVLGEITTGGRLVDQLGETLARFQQIYRVWRGSRLLEIDVELDPVHEPAGDPWKFSYCARFAWSDESWLLYRCVNDVRETTDSKRIECPTYLELNGAEERTTIFPCGLPFHRRVGFRMIDTLLSVPGENRRHFRLAIGVDVKNPWQQAQWLAAPAIVFPSRAAPDPDRQSGWLFRINVRHVSATSWEPIYRQGRCVGVQVRLLETAGKEAQVQLHCFRPLLAARQVDFRGEVEADCRVDSGSCHVRVAGHEWVQVELYWDEYGLAADLENENSESEETS